MNGRFSVFDGATAVPAAYSAAGQRARRRDTFKPGDKVTVTVPPSKIGTTRGLLAKIVLNGKVVPGDTTRRRRAAE